jgi:two-component system chemotaxis sensor kinase CheA
VPIPPDREETVDSFEQLKAEFLAETEDTLESLQKDLDRLSRETGSGEAAPEVVDRVFRTTHSLKGVAGMFGLDAMSRVAHALESVFEDLRERRRSLDTALCDRLYEGHELLFRLLGHATGEGEDPTESAGVWAARLEADRQARVPRPGRFLAAIGELTAEERQDVARAAASGRTVALIEAEYDEQTFREPFQALLTATREWGTVHATIPGFAAKEAGRFRVRIVASGREPLFALLKVVAPRGAEVFGDEEGALLALTGEAAAESSPGPDPSTPADSTGTATGPAARSPVAAPIAHDDLARGAILRVPVARVDRLLGELGDVVQAKLALDSTAERILEHAPDRMSRTQARQTLRHLDRRLRTLQDGILGVRMVPLESLYRKLERSLRETCRATGRRARLVAEGEKIELDKGVAEALADPLVHLLRNAVDHGIEDPASRVAAGKDPVGIVRVSAFADGSWTVLEIGDDGNGVDLSGVLVKARERGLVAPGTEPTRAELLGLIFRPGFSIRDEATEVSGRGVGLDAVRETVTALGGRLDLETGEQGTTFRLRLPVTLAVVQALEIELGGQSFFLPLANVTSVGRTDRERLETVDGGEVLLEEGTTRPVLDLSELYGLGQTPRDRTRLPCVTVRDGDRETVLLVESLGRRRDIVVRPLGGILPPIPGVAGSTELGDGRTRLILDPAARLRPARTPEKTP